MAAGCKNPKLVAGEDGVVEGAKSLGRMHGTEIGANFNPAASPSRRMSHKSPPIELSNDGGSLTIMHVDKLHDKSTLCI